MKVDCYERTLLLRSTLQWRSLNRIHSGIRIGIFITIFEAFLLALCSHNIITNKLDKASGQANNILVFMVLNQSGMICDS